MANTKPELKSLRKLLDKPDRRAVINFYLNIKVNAFIEYFKALTNRPEYYDEVFASLVEISKDIYIGSSDAWLRESLTVREVLFVAEELLKRDQNNACKMLFIIEKALMEPLAICGNIQNEIPAADSKTTENSNLRKDVL